MTIWTLHEPASKQLSKFQPAPANRFSGGATYLLAALQSTEGRSAVLDSYRGEGHSPDDFGKPAARLAVASALTRWEDALEFRQGHQNAAEAKRCRDLRRALELEAA